MMAEVTAEAQRRIAARQAVATWQRLGRAKQQLDKGNLSPSAYKGVVAKVNKKLGK